MFVVQCLPYPNVGLPVGYWAYPNRAIAAFRNCPNVHSVELGRVNHDLDLEEFDIYVEFEGKSGRLRENIAFPQYPSRAEIEERVSRIGCTP